MHDEADRIFFEKFILLSAKNVLLLSIAAAMSKYGTKNNNRTSNIEPTFKFADLSSPY